MEEWIVTAAPVGANPKLKPGGKRDRKTGDPSDKDKDNVGGVVVFVARAHQKEEVARVGFIREASENPDVPFKDKLDEIIQVAQDTCDTLNELTPDGELQ